MKTNLEGERSATRASPTTTTTAQRAMIILKKVILYLFDGPDWVTWVTHSVIAFFIAWWVNPPAAIVAYAHRALSHILYAFGTGAPRKWADRIPDVAFPTAVALAVWRYL